MHRVEEKIHAKVKGANAENILVLSKHLFILMQKLHGVEHPFELHFGVEKIRILETSEDVIQMV